MIANTVNEEVDHKAIKCVKPRYFFLNHDCSQVIMIFKQKKNSKMLKMNIESIEDTEVDSKFLKSDKWQKLGSEDIYLTDPDYKFTPRWIQREQKDGLVILINDVSPSKWIVSLIYSDIKVPDTDPIVKEESLLTVSHKISSRMKTTIVHPFWTILKEGTELISINYLRNYYFYGELYLPMMLATQNQDNTRFTQSLIFGYWDTGPDLQYTVSKFNCMCFILRFISMVFKSHTSRFSPVMILRCLPLVT